MNYFKIIFFTGMLVFFQGSLSANVEGVMGIVDGGEDFFLNISKRFKTFLCGTKERVMDTSFGRGVNALLCGDISQLKIIPMFILILILKNSIYPFFPCLMV